MNDYYEIISKGDDIDMISRYGIFCRVIENESFTRTAEEMGYSQSAVSQNIKALEQELGTVLIERKKDGIALTVDGQQFYPYIQAVFQAEKDLAQKQKEMSGLENSTIRIGTFTSVSRNLLPQIMKKFKEHYPQVNFVLQQGEYTSIGRWVQEGSVDFGFVNADAVSGVEMQMLYEDEMMAVLPQGHPFCVYKEVSLTQLAKEPFILLDEGDYSVPLNAFSKQKLSPNIEYKVYDDYSILAMVRQGLGVSVLYQLVLKGYEEGLEIRPIIERPRRKVALAWRSWETMPLSARRFVSFVQEYIIASGTCDMHGD